MYKKKVINLVFLLIMHCIFMSDQHFYENQTKNMGSLAITKNLNSDLKSTQKNTKKTHDSPMHYFHFLFNIGKLHCGFYIWGVLGGSWYSWHNPDFFFTVSRSQPIPSAYLIIENEMSWLFFPKPVLLLQPLSFYIWKTTF